MNVKRNMGVQPEDSPTEPELTPEEHNRALGNKPLKRKNWILIWPAIVFSLIVIVLILYLGNSVQQNQTVKVATPLMTSIDTSSTTATDTVAIMTAASATADSASNDTGAVNASVVVGIQATAPAIIAATPTAVTSPAAMSSTVSQPPERVAIKPASSKTTAKPKPAASAWVALVDSMLLSHQTRLDTTEAINQRQSQAITALTVDVDWLVLQQARLYSSLKNSGEIVGGDMLAFINASVDERDKMMEAVRPQPGQ